MSRLEENDYNYKIQDKVKVLYHESVRAISEGNYEEAQCIFDEMEELQNQYIM